MMRSLSLLTLALAACADHYGVQFSDTSAPPLQVTLTNEQAALFEGAVVRTTMKLTVNGSVSSDVAETDLDLRSDNPQVIQVYRGIDPFTFVVIGAVAGQTQLGAYFQDSRVATINAAVAAQSSP
jgi:hypothetical protein